MEAISRKFCVFLSSVMLVFASVGYSMAASVELTVRAGKTTGIYGFAVFGENNCKAHQRVTIKDKKTKNGKVTGRNGSFIADSGRCKGKRLRSVNAYYTPDPGFRGVDKFRFCYQYDKYDGAPMPKSSRCIRAKITVK